MIQSPNSFSTEKLLILQILQRAILDYLEPEKIFPYREKERHYKSARSFLFDNNHYIEFGDWCVDIHSLLQEVDLSLEVIRKRILEVEEKRGRAMRP